MSEHTQKARDVLAAEEFSIGVRDSRYPPDPTGIPGPHDVLAAEAFAMPLRDTRFPRDPSGSLEPHDVLAAEEFAMPAASPALERPDARTGGFGGLFLLAGLGLAAVLLLTRRWR